MDKAGAFTVVWEGSAGGSGHDAVARRFDSAGTALGAEFRVNTYTVGNQFSPAIGMDPSGNFTIAWESPQDGAGAGSSGSGSTGPATSSGPSFRSTATRRTTSSFRAWQPRAAATSSRSGAASVRTATAGESTGSARRFRLRRPFRWTRGRPRRARPTSTDFSSPERPSWSSRAGRTRVHAARVHRLRAVVHRSRGATYGIDDATADYGSIAAGGSEQLPRRDGRLLRGDGLQPRDAPGHALGRDASGNPVGRHPQDLDAPRRPELLRRADLAALLQEDRDPPALRNHDRVHGDDVLPRQHGHAFRDVALRRPGRCGQRSGDSSDGTLNGNAYSCGAGGTSLFTDVPPTDISCQSVHYIAAQNVTTGCSPTDYCPTPNVTRDEMSSFMARAIVAPGGGTECRSPTARIP